MRRAAALTALVLVLVSASAAAAKTTLPFRPRIGNALGLVPVSDGQTNSTGPLQPVTYHGGEIMSGGVTVHTIFWTGGTQPFAGQPAGAPHDYVGMIQQFFTDAAHDSTGTSGAGCTQSACNSLTVLPQFGSGLSRGQITSGANSISYDPASDSLIDTNPYPAKPQQCASPGDAAVCVTDAQVQDEIDSVIAVTPGQPRGLHDLWFVFLPPGVDECAATGFCATNFFGGYHAWIQHGGQQTIYAVVPDPIIFSQRTQGRDPEGYPDAERAIDVAAHETVEAISDPTGAGGWYDPEGFEIGDKCEFGPQRGTPLGFASDGAPYNQVINGHQYLIQEEWANADNNGYPDCVQATTNTSNPLPLPQVHLTQYSPTVTGNTGTGVAAVGVTVSLIRAAQNGPPVTVAQASTTTTADGSWSVSLTPHVVGDDRDEIVIDYSGVGAPVPHHQPIMTGNSQSSDSGWTGWYYLDGGNRLTNEPSRGGPSLSVVGCSAAGSISSSITPQSLSDFCSTTDGIATESLLGPVGGDVGVTVSSTDNRGWQPPPAAVPNPDGNLVTLTVPVGEADAVSNAFGMEQHFAAEGLSVSLSGLASCTADLAAQAVACTGMVPAQRYTIADRVHSVSAAADDTGLVSAAMPLQGGDTVTLFNGLRTLATLHVAHLRAALDDANPGAIAAGSCEPGQYFGAPLSEPPLPGVPGAGAGAALTGQVCPPSGDATGMPSDAITQTDELSGGLTQTEVPRVTVTAPMAGETVYGAFPALAESTDSVSPIAVSIAPAGGGAAVFSAANVDTPDGTLVSSLARGTYDATWTVTDANGDTRTRTTRFVYEPGSPGPSGSSGASGSTGPLGQPGQLGQPGPTGQTGPVGQIGSRGPQGPASALPKVTCKLVGRHLRSIRCQVSVPSATRDRRGTVLISIARGARIVGLGRGELGHGRATVTMRALRALTGGGWRITLVVLSAGHRPHTFTLPLGVAHV
jgi:hypothetical protein